jgi:hypothetical protein
VSDTTKPGFVHLLNNKKQKGLTMQVSPFCNVLYALRTQQHRPTRGGKYDDDGYVRGSFSFAVQK